MAWQYTAKIILVCQGDAERQWMAELSNMIRISLLAWMSGGAFLSLSYLDLPWHLIAILILLKEMSAPTVQRTARKSALVAELPEDLKLTLNLDKGIKNKA